MINERNWCYAIAVLQVFFSLGNFQCTYNDSEKHILLCKSKNSDCSKKCFQCQVSNFICRLYSLEQSEDAIDPKHLLKYLSKKARKKSEFDGNTRQDANEYLHDLIRVFDVINIIFIN